jgi:hypothetical protein
MSAFSGGTRRENRAGRQARGSAGTPTPDRETLSMPRGCVLDELAETYPQFAELLHADAVGRAA